MYCWLHLKNLFQYNIILLLSVKSNTIPEKERSTFCIRITYIKEGVYRVLVGKPEGRRPLGRPRRRWADNIRKDLQEVGCG